MTLPIKALSVRQPWAWAIIHAGKDIENRSWRSSNFRGRVAIHASKGMEKAEYYESANFIKMLTDSVPQARDLARGGIIGSVEIVDAVRSSPSPWFFGPFGLVLANPEPCDFIPVKGQLGFFDWRKNVTDETPEPAPWMLPKRAETQGSLL